MARFDYGRRCTSEVDRDQRARHGINRLMLVNYGQLLIEEMRQGPLEPRRQRVSTVTSISTAVFARLLQHGSLLNANDEKRICL